MSRRYLQSEQLLSQACQTIPLGAQTFSKSQAALPFGVSPFYAESAKGAYLYDVDGHEYIDFVSGLLSISLGYADPDVEQAVINQLKSGVNFSLPHRLESECAELLCHFIPSAEQVRFGKNGSDVTSAAIRLARAYTGRDHIAACGYHGWHDWYIGSTTRNLGVPGCVSDLTHLFQYNNIDSLKSLFDQYDKSIAAVILEPMTFEYPKDEFLEQCLILCEQYGAILIFDEMITGFRFNIGGAQKEFAVTPHLTTIGKGVANGYPLSALVGKREIMEMMKDIFFSTTFGGETLSLAAAIATINKMNDVQSIEQIKENGNVLIQRLNDLLNSEQLSTLFEIKGHPTWTSLMVQQHEMYSSQEIKSVLLENYFLNNLFCQGTHNLSYAHSEEHIEQLLLFYKEWLPIIAQNIKSGTLLDHFSGQILEPIFQVRS